MKCRNMSIKFKNVALFIKIALKLVLLRPFGKVYFRKYVQKLNGEKLILNFFSMTCSASPYFCITSINPYYHQDGRRRLKISSNEAHAAMDEQ